jgi:hypothetical protein
MLKTIANRYAKRAAARRRAIRRKAAAWKQRARRAFTLMLVAGGMMGSAGVAHAQMGGMGQAAMAPTGGIVNRAVTRLQVDALTGVERSDRDRVGAVDRGQRRADRTDGACVF